MNDLVQLLIEMGAVEIQHVDLDTQISMLTFVFAGRRATLVGGGKGAGLFGTVESIPEQK